MHGCKEPVIHITKNEVLMAAATMENGANFGAENVTDIRSAVESALAKVSFYPIYGDEYADLKVIMANIDGVLGENRNSFMKALNQVINDADNPSSPEEYENVTLFPVSQIIDSENRKLASL
ncbi:MAG: hypothetical protein PHP74_00675 [Candidatus Gracilibacteria bacterium]|nr:hypothetical protein [Candidatus Gracilibacteria bacterium]